MNVREVRTPTRHNTEKEVTGFPPFLENRAPAPKTAYSLG